MRGKKGQVLKKNDEKLKVCLDLEPISTGTGTDAQGFALFLANGYPSRT